MNDKTFVDTNILINAYDIGAGWQARNRQRHLLEIMLDADGHYVNSVGFKAKLLLGQFGRI
jgi:hypothetical protein